jgi:5-hydroxyisourate hydrolase-like protein (transthyretin family)
MGLSTHVLDTMHGVPAGGMKVSLYTTQAGQATLVKSFTLNDDGRSPDGPLYDSSNLKAGTYRLVFDVAATSRHAAWRCPSRPSWTRSAWISAWPIPPRITTCLCW